MKINKTYIPLLVFSCIALGILLGGFINFPSQKPFFAKNNYKTKLNKLIDFIDKEYVDEVKTDSIVDLTVNNILSNLDPHSTYLPKEIQTQEAENMKGDFVGIGISFYLYKDSVAVINAIENGPAKKAGIQAGDRILYANKSKLFGKKITSTYLYQKLRGEEGSDVVLTVFRKKTKKTFQLSINRGSVPIKSIDTYFMLDKNTGYIKINRFAETTYNEFKTALGYLKQKKCTQMVIDLRENGGGFLERAVEIADELLKENELIVVTKNKKGKTQKTYATSEGLFETGKVYVLIDENSASASEILAGAIQDNDRGTVVGRRSFGKGLVQKEINFDDGSAVRLTIARYYTPSGRSIQKPYIKGESENYFNEFGSRFENGELYEKDKIKIADSLKFKTKKGRTVFGGGGIVPDLFVPLEVNHGDEKLEYLLKTGVVSHFVFEQLDNPKNDFKKYTLSQLITKINTENHLIKAFRTYLLQMGLDLNLEQNKAIVKRYLTAEFARQLFGENQYYLLLLKEDQMIKTVLSKTASAL